MHGYFFSYMDPKNSHRRSSVNGPLEELIKGYQAVVTRSHDPSSLLGSTSSRLALNAALAQQQRASGHNLGMGQSVHRATGSLYRVPGPSTHRMAIQSRLLINSILGQPSLLEVPDTDIDQQQKSDVRRSHPSDSDEDNSIESASEKVLNVTHATVDEDGADDETGARVHFKEEEEQVNTKKEVLTRGSVQKNKLGVSDHVVAARKKAPSKEKQPSKKTERECDR